MKLVYKYPILGSSQDASKISLTIKSLGLALIPIILAVCRLNDLEIVENDLIKLVNSVATIASMFGVVIGFARKLWN